MLSRRELRELGVARGQVAREIRAERWASGGRHSVILHTGPLAERATWRRAVWEVGASSALDGVTALQAAGLTGYTERRLHVSVPHGHSHRQAVGVRVHRLRGCWRNGERVDVLRGSGIRRVHPALAAVRAAHWAVSDRQAALVLCLVVQQRIVTTADLGAAARHVRGRARRAFVGRVVADVTDGAHSLGELDFAVMCRARGLPEPSRQVVCRGPRGRIYLDVEWEDIRLVVEIDGAQHRQGLAVTADNLRRNSLAIGDRTVLTIDLVGLRVEQDAFLDQVVQAHRFLSRR